jgi:folylpolyglutamate synthase
MNAFEIAWKIAVPSAQIMLKQNINDAIVTARAMSIESGAVHTLITGSQHLVGGALFCLGNDRKAACSTQHASQDQP